jgi:hypothetical protein
MTNAIKVLLQMTSVSLQPVPSLKSELFRISTGKEWEKQDRYVNKDK